jgi:hypothetical protein
MYDLTQLTLQNVTDIGIALRSLGKGADSLEMVAERCVQYFQQNFVDPTTGESACALTRFFKTHAYGELPSELQAQAQQVVSIASLADSVKCLTLLSTVGDRREWCDRKASSGHQAIPLTSEKAVSQIPMIAQLIRGFGLDIGCVLAPEPERITQLERQTCNVFYIPEAAGSPFIPAQSEFVEPFGIKSVMGFGGILPSGNLFAIILFSKAKIPETTAHLLKILPLSLKMAILPFDKGHLFRPLQTV